MCSLMALCATPSLAEDDNDGLDRFSEGGVSYCQTERGVWQVYVTAAMPGTSYKGAMTVPDTVSWKGNRYAVVGIEKDAFGGCRSLRSVKLPNTLRDIGLGAFAGCQNLTDVTLPDSLQRIPPLCFSKCPMLTGINIPQSLVSIGRQAFQGCESLENVRFPKSLGSIEKKAFLGCAKLKKVAMYQGCQFAENAFDPLVTIQLRARN